MEYAVAIDRVLGHEAGYVNDPADPGGETKWGISKREYPHLNIKELSREAAISIYYHDYWRPLHVERYPSAVAYQLLDSAVHSGIGQSIRFLQRAIGAADDGRWGPESQRAIDATDINDALLLFLAERVEFMTKLRNWPSHGRGWARRIAKNLRYAAKDN